MQNVFIWCHESYNLTYVLLYFQRKAFLEKKKAMDLKDADLEDENNEEDSFMVLDSVGSADGTWTLVFSLVFCIGWMFTVNKFVSRCRVKRWVWEADWIRRRR